jgi:hypothetical protein
MPAEVDQFWRDIFRSSLVADCVRMMADDVPDHAIADALADDVVDAAKVGPDAPEAEGLADAVRYATTEIIRCIRNLEALDAEVAALAADPAPPRPSTIPSLN